MPRKKTNSKNKPAKRRPRKTCGLCGATQNLTKTDCCGKWICDDESSYELFSYAHSSCFRNHRRYTLCGGHYAEGHSGKWQDCKHCREEITETEMYVYYGTNDYNFEKLTNPPAYQPTKCNKCNSVIVLADGGYSVSGDEYLCYDCTALEFPNSPI